MTSTPTSFAEALEIEVRRALAGHGKCRIAIRKEKLKPADRGNVDLALDGQVTGTKISAAFKLLAEEGDLAVGDTTIKLHRTRKCSCYKPGGEFFDDGESKG
jgi:hypothetical protein